MAFCDLHAHSTASDGTTRPGDLGGEAKAAGLSAVALTDHDTTAGLVEASAGCRRAEVAFVPGIEVSSDRLDAKLDVPHNPIADRARRGTLHILGYFVRHDDPVLMEVTAQLQRARRDRNPEIVARLQSLGVRIDYEEVVTLASRVGGDDEDEGGSGGTVVGRPHIAQVLVNKGYAKSVQDAFSRYVGEGKPAYVRKDNLAPAQAIEGIHHAGGLAVLAHPVQLRCADDDELEHVVKQLKLMGLDGVETRHPDHAAGDTERFEKLARRFGLLTSGGSDYHGGRKPIALGSQRVPMEVYERLREAAGGG